MDLKRKDGGSAVMIASQKGHSKLVKILLENGATVDMQNNEGDTALLIASSEGYPEVARLLLKSCAQVTILGDQL